MVFKEEQEKEMEFEELDEETRLKCVHLDFSR